MARTIAEIKKSMTDTFMANESIRTAYGLTSTDTFSNVFSSVSVENILFYIVASCIYVLETIFDQFRTEVDTKITESVVASVPWYYKLARAYQKGDSLVWDEETQDYVYESEDETKQVITYAAVRDLGTSIKILVSTGDTPTVLSDEELTAFKAYMNRRKIAGVVLGIYSKERDIIEVNATIQVDGITLDTTGKRVGGTTYPVVEAIDDYLKNITYGGTFNKTKLVDAIQTVDGVVDVVLGNCYQTADGGTRTLITSNNYTSAGGAFVSSGLNTSLTYVVAI